MGLSTIALKRIAIYGGVVSLGGCVYLASKIQDNFRNQSYYKESLKVLADYPSASQLLGKPIKIRKLDLGDTTKNYTDGVEAKLTIPLKGRIKAGTLHAWSSRSSTKEEWRVDKCDLEMEGHQWTFFINPKSTKKVQKTEQPNELSVTSSEINNHDTTTGTLNNSELIYVNIGK